MARRRITRPDESLVAEMQLGDHELALRKEFLELGDEDVARLEGMYELTLAHVDAVIEEFYGHLLSFAETAAYFQDPEVLAYVKGKQKEYFIRLTQGDYNQDYVENRLRLGAVHQAIGLPVKSFLGMYAFYLRALAARLLETYPDDPDRAFESF